MSLTTERGDFSLLILQMSKWLGKVKSYHREVWKQNKGGRSGIPGIGAWLFTLWARRFCCFWTKYFHHRRRAQQEPQSWWCLERGYSMGKKQACSQAAFWDSEGWTGSVSGVSLFGPCSISFLTFNTKSVASFNISAWIGLLASLHPGCVIWRRLLDFSVPLPLCGEVSGCLGEQLLLHLWRP